METIRVLVVDDHAIIREGLEFFLGLDSGLTVLGTAKSAIEGLERLRKLNPDVVVLDLSMPHLSGMDAIQLFRDAKPEVKIVIFTAREEEKFLHHALQAGAKGYVLKGTSTEALKQAIRYVWQGEYWISPQFSASLVKSYLQAPGLENGELEVYRQLTDRERQVFRLIVDGRQTEEISEILCISGNTVAKHRNSLKEKLGMNNAVEMTKFALRNGLVEN